MESVVSALAAAPTLTIGIVEADLVIGDWPIPRAAETMGELMRRLEQAGIERIVFDRGVQVDEILQLVVAVAKGEGSRDPALSRLQHVRVGRLQVEQQVEASIGDVATFRKLYDDAVSVAGRLWESADTEGKPDADAARGFNEGLDLIVQGCNLGG